MHEKGESTPPQKEETEKGLSVPMWFVAVLIIATIAVVFGPPLIAETNEGETVGDTTNSGEGGTDANIDPVTVETEETERDTGIEIVPKETATEISTTQKNSVETTRTTEYKNIILNIPVEIFENKDIDVGNVVVSQLSHENGQLQGHITYPNLPDRHGVSIELLRIEGQGMPIGTYFKPSNDFNFFFTVKDEDLNNCKIRVRLKIV